MSETSTLILSGITLLVILGIVFYLKLRLGKSGNAWKNTVHLKLTELDQLMDSTDLQHLKNAFFEIDKLLNFVLKSKKVKGETLGQRLKNIKDHFDWDEYQRIWESHKARNKLAHDMEFELKAEHLKTHYNQLRKAIRRYM